MSLFNTLRKGFNTKKPSQEGARKITSSDYSQEMKTVSEKTEVCEQIGVSAVWIKGNDEDGYYLMIANYKITRKIDTYEKAQIIAEQTDWENLINAMACMIEIAFIMESGHGVRDKDKIASIPS